MNVEEALLNSSEILSQRFLMLIQAASGIRELTALKTDDLNEPELLDRLLNVLIENLDLDRCSIFLLDEDRLNCAAGKDWDEYIHQSGRKITRPAHTFRIGEGIMGKAAETGRVYHCKNCRSDNHYLPVISSDSENNSGSLICAPIMAGKELLGILNISHPEPNFFHAWQEHIVAIHANILAQMLHNHRLMHDVKLEVDKRTRELEEALCESEILKNEFKELSLVDELTQLNNRRYFFTEIPRIISNCMRYSEPFSLLLLDLDNFKQINDTHGHVSGDQVLKDVGNILGQQIRTGDLVARIGGEEFVFALPCTNLNGARKFADRIREKVAELTWYLDDSSFQVTISIGISEMNERDMDIDLLTHELLGESDQALYACKSLGKNQVSTYSELDKLKQE